MSSESSESLTSFFSQLDALDIFFCVIALAYNFSTMLNQERFLGIPVRFSFLISSFSVLLFQFENFLLLFLYPLDPYLLFVQCSMHYLSSMNILHIVSLSFLYERLNMWVTLFRSSELHLYYLSIRQACISPPLLHLSCAVFYSLCWDSLLSNVHSQDAKWVIMDSSKV